MVCINLCICMQIGSRRLSRARAKAIRLERNINLKPGKRHIWAVQITSIELGKEKVSNSIFRGRFRKGNLKSICQITLVLVFVLALKLLFVFVFVFVFVFIVGVGVGVAYR